MMVLVSYDIKADSGTSWKRRLRKIANICKDHGQRAQYSVFECNVSPANWVSLKEQLLKMYNPKTDSLRFYYLGSNWQKKIEHYGAKPVWDTEKDALII